MGGDLVECHPVAAGNGAVIAMILPHTFFEPAWPTEPCPIGHRTGKAGSALAFACSEVCNFLTISSGVAGDRPISGVSSLFSPVAGQGPFPQPALPGVPVGDGLIRHLSRPALALTGSLLTIGCEPWSPRQTSLVAH